MPRLFLAVAAALVLLAAVGGHGFQIEEATVDTIQQGFRNGSLTSVCLVQFYLDRIHDLNPLLRAVIEVNPDALRQAERADAERRSGKFSTIGGRGGQLHGVPVLLKDNIATRDELNTTAGSFALLGSRTKRDAGVVSRLRRAGAIVLGKANMDEWSNFRSLDGTDGWSAPSLNSVVGIKPTVGLTSRAGVVPITPREDTVGPICRTVTDAVRVLDAIAGYDALDAAATRAASKYIPHGGYMQFLKNDGLMGKRIGVPNGFFDNPNGTLQLYQQHLNSIREQGAIIIENLDIENLSTILDTLNNGQQIALPAEFKLSLNAYLSDLTYSPVRSLAEVIAFNIAHPVEEKLEEVGQLIFLVAENTTGIGATEKAAIRQLKKLSTDGLEKLMKEHKLDAVVTPNDFLSRVLAIGGMPGITVPAGYGKMGVPFGLCFGGMKGYEPRLIEMAYAFEQVTKVRKAPTFMA
ncbi:probable amidase At4g34880 isoform X2 [Lolium rigidum]|uniref:probable amidase At4g34880 isoform X2 n=1 Tax=Lolium rigidum TaxID=89674 RepID=UPI001F5DD13A|nr:probable amidase At4g34880 isoform X2 [Lolium rigidum]